MRWAKYDGATNQMTYLKTTASTGATASLARDVWSSDIWMAGSYKSGEWWLQISRIYSSNSSTVKVWTFSYDRNGGGSSCNHNNAGWDGDDRYAAYINHLGYHYESLLY